MSITTFVSDTNKDELLKEEWIDIADITTTEEVVSFQFTKDINGNPFSCKKLYVSVIFPSNLEKDTGFGFSLDKYKWNPLAFYPDQGEFYVTFDVVEGQFIDLALHSAPLGDGLQGYGNQNTRRLYHNAENSVNISSFDLWSGDGVAVPTGTIIKIWGLKA